MTYTNELYKTRIARIYTSADDNVINVVGGGVLISDQYIVTCAHVVADALRIDHTTQDKPLGLIKLDFPFLTEGNKQNSRANILLWKPLSNSDYSYYSYGEDIAVLELSEKLPTNNITFQLSLADITNHPFSVVGFPKGNDPGIITKGKLLGAVSDGLGLVQMEVENLSLPYIQPGFSGAPVWDEDLKSFVGIVVSSELCKYSDNTVGRPAEELRKDTKIAYMIPAKVLVETWSFLQQFVQEESGKINQHKTMQPSRIQQRIKQELVILRKKQEAVQTQKLMTIDEDTKVTLQLKIDEYDKQIYELEHQIFNM